MSTPSSSDLAGLHALLDDGQVFDAEYDQGLANHLPMLLHAMHALGATPERLREQVRSYAPRLSVATNRPPAGWIDWRVGLGRLDAFAAMRASFSATIARDGIADTLIQALPTLMPGIAAGAFHGLLRTAHGLSAHHAAEVAAGLAYWAAAHRPLVVAAPNAGQSVTRHPPRELIEWAAALLALPAPADADAPLISLRMSAWARTPGFGAAACALAIDRARPDATLAGIARLAAQGYAASRDFTLLHVVTSCHAMRVLSPFQPDAAQAVRDYSIAVAAGLCATRLPLSAVLGDRPEVSGLDWSAIVGAAIASDDDHFAKLVYACHALEAELGGAEFRRAAAAYSRRAAPAAR